MKIITKNKEIISKLKGNEITYLFNDNDDIYELVQLSRFCKVKREDYDLYDIAIDCANANALYYYTSDIEIKDISELTKKKDYKFSIIIPNCNYSEWLDKCINSVLNQTYKNFEIIFVDDCSTDNSVEIAEKLLRPQDKLIKLKSKRLNGGARNEGLIYTRDCSDSDYIVFLDSDDWLIDNYVLENYNRTLCGQDVMFVGVTRMKNNDVINTWGLVKYNNKYEAMSSGHSGSCFKVIKKELAVNPKCFFSEGTLQEDRNHHCKICYYMKSFIVYGKVSHIWNRDNIKSICTIRDKVKWGTSVYRNYADCKQFLLEIEDDKDERAIDVLKSRLIAIDKDIKNNKDWQH